MKTKNNKAVVVLMTAALLLTSLLPSGCVSRKNRDMTEIQLKAEEFIYQFATGDADTVKELVDGRFDYQISLAKQHEIMLKIASKTEIDDIETIEVDRKAGKAKIRTKLSYIDISEFGRDKNNRNISVEECIANVDTYESRQTSNFTFNFVLGDDGTWKIKDTTAERYEDLFNHQYFLSVMSISKDKAKEICLDIFNRLARGELRQELFTYDINEMGAMNTWSRDAENIKDAMTEFAKAYFTFYTEHGLTIVETANAYEYKITGYMPSKEGLMSYYASEEYAIESNMAEIRAETAGDDKKRQEVWDSFIAGIYYDMAKQMPNLMGEEFSIILKVVNDGKKVKIEAKSALCSITTDDIFAAPKYDYAQDKAARKKAIQALFDAGELTRAQYDKYMSEFRNDGGNYSGRNNNNDNASNGTTSWQGTSDTIFPVTALQSWSNTTGNFLRERNLNSTGTLTEAHKSMPFLSSCLRTEWTSSNSPFLQSLCQQETLQSSDYGKRAIRTLLRM